MLAHALDGLRLHACIASLRALRAPFALAGGMTPPSKKGRGMQVAQLALAAYLDPWWLCPLLAAHAGANSCFL